VLPKSVWKVFKSDWDDRFFQSIKGRPIFIVSQKPIVGEMRDLDKPSVFPHLHQMSLEFPFKDHVHTESDAQFSHRQELTDRAQQAKRERVSNDEMDYESVMDRKKSAMEHASALQTAIDELLTDVNLPIESVLLSPKLSFDWKQTPWAQQMKHYKNYEKLRSNYVPGHFMAPYQKIFVNHVESSDVKNQKLEQLIRKSMPLGPSFLNDTLHLHSISMRLSYSDENMLSSYVLPIYQVNRECLFVQAIGKTRFMLFDPLHTDWLSPSFISLEKKVDNDLRDGQLLHSTIDPFNVIENVNRALENNQEQPREFHLSPFLKHSVPLTVDLNEHEVLYVPAFWWVLEIGIHPINKYETMNLVLRQEYDPHHAVLDVVMSGMGRHYGEFGASGLEVQKRAVRN